MSLAILFHFLCAQHVSDINTSNIRSLQLFCWITTLVMCSWFDVCWCFSVVGLAWYPLTTQTQPHQISNTQRTKNKTTDVAIKKNSCKLLMMDILMSETCWAHKKWNKTASDIKLVFCVELSQWCTVKLTLKKILLGYIKDSKYTLFKNKNCKEWDIITI